MKYLLIPILLLAGNINIYAATDPLFDGSRDFTHLCSYVNAKEGQPFNEQDYAEFDKYLAVEDEFSLYMNASVLWDSEDPQVVEKAMTAFRHVVDKPCSDYIFSAAAKIIQVHPDQSDNFASIVAEKLRSQTSEQKRIAAYLSYPGMTEGEPAEYTESFKDKELIDSFKKKILDFLLGPST